MSPITSNVYPVVVRLRRGREQRNLHVAIFSDMKEPDRIAPRQVLEAFVNGVEEGLLGNVILTGAKLAVKVLPEQGLTVDILTAGLFGLAARELVVLPNMVRASVPGARGLEILEDHPNERSLVVRTLIPDTEETLVEVGFSVGLAPELGPHIQVAFLNPPTAATVERLDGLVQAWVSLVRLGAYPLSNGELGVAEWVESVSVDAAVRFARFERLVCGHAAHEALLGALGQLSDDAPIAHLTMGTLSAMSEPAALKNERSSFNSAQS